MKKMLQNIFGGGGTPSLALAFTLAEVLITLGIIGVVASLTMPALIEKHKEQVIVRKLEKMYSVLSNAYNMYKIDNPQAPELPWSEQGAVEAYKIFKPYLNIMKDCGTRDTSCYHKNGLKSVSEHRTYVAYGNDSRYYKVILSDGSTLMFRGGTDSGKALIVMYDVNGKQGPNIWAKDFFQFEVYADSNIIRPHGFSSNEFNNDCLSAGAQGDGCTGWVILNKNMDYLHCKGLIYDKHTSCKDLKK